jgi:heat shock protein HslJ
MRYVPLLLILAALVGCASAEKIEGPPPPPPPAADPLTKVIGTQWLVEDIGGKPVMSGVQTTLRFDAPGKVSGSGGCNLYNGGVRIMSGTLLFGPIQTTRKACPEAVMKQETAYFDALVGARGVEVDGGALYFLDLTNSRSVRFSQLAAPPAP